MWDGGTRRRRYRRARARKGLSSGRMKIAYVVYPDFTALDLIGPYEVISLWPDVELHWVATTPGPIHTDHGLAVMPTTTPAGLPDPDVVVIPRGGKPRGPLQGGG